MRHTGIPIIGDAPWGTHFCQFYQDKQDLIEILVPYFKAGLEDNEFCMWITSEPLDAEDARRALAREVENLDDYIQRGQIEILNYSQWYTPGGKFDSDRVLRGWVEKLDGAKERGFEGLRLTGNTFWLEKPDWQSFTDYEAAVDSVIGEYDMLAICTYSLAKCGAVEIMDVVSNHAFALIKRLGEWRVIESAERKRIEAALRESEKRLQFATNAAEIGVWSWKPGTNDVEVSGHWRQLFGIAPEAGVTFETWRRALDAEDRDRAIRELNAAAEERREFNTEYRIAQPDGSVRWISDRGRASYGEDGRPSGMAGINVDITALKQAQEALRREREWLRVTLTSIGDAVLATDAEGRITFLNPVAAALTGWGEREALGVRAKDVLRTVNEETREAGEDIIARVLREGCTLSLANHTAIVRRDGREIPIEDSAAPIRDSGGKVSGAVLVFHDVTEKRRAQEALHESEERVRRKLDSILSPEGDVGNLELRDIIDAPAIQSLMEKFYRLAPLPMAMIDLNGDVVVGVGWQEICTKFHRACPESCRHCVESDTELSHGIAPGKCRLYKCKNNMWDIATPIVIGERHVGNLFSGQFFFEGEEVDREVFRVQAQTYGFDEREYLAALERVPRLRREFVDAGMAFLTQLGHMLSLLSYSNLKLARSLAERDALTSSLKASEERFNRAQEMAHLGSWEADVPNNRVYWSDEVYRIFGVERQGFCGTAEGFLDCVHPEDREAVTREYARSLGVGEPAYDIVHRAIRKDSGELRWVHERCTHVRDAEGRVVRSVGMIQDITDRKRLEEQVRQRAEEIETVMDVAPVAIWVAHDPECNHITGNRLANSFYEAGEEENVSANATAVRRFFKDGRELQATELPMQQATSTGADIRDAELEVLLPSGRRIHMLGQTSPLRDASGRVRGGIGAFLDITDRKQTEERLRQAQKLESLGVLAGGVAHDFNNLLVGVIGNASLAQDLLPEDSPAAALLAGVVRNGERAAHLTRQMLAYAGKGRVLTEALDLSELIPEMTGLVQPSIPKKIVLHLELDPKLPAVEADRGHIQQVFMNLVLNAAEAIGSGAAGVIRVQTGVRRLTGHENSFEVDGGIRAGRYVCLEVRDTGCGIEEQIRKRIFDPFFSTKFTGRGLGLAAVAGIVRAHKGAVEVSSEAGRGSCFTVLFPAAEGAAADGRAPAVETLARGSGTVLVVDDEEVVRETARKALERQGYKVLVADSGAAGIDVLKCEPEPISLLLLDLSMPGMSGEEALPELLKIRPKVKVLISSGYNESETLQLFRGLPVAGFVQKPYTARGLVKKVREALG